jgi:hypothetical protein
MLTNWSTNEPDDERPKKQFDPFDVVFCCHCDKLHHVDSHSYIQLFGYIYRGRTIDLMDEADVDIEVVDDIGELGVRSYLSYIGYDEVGDDIPVSIFCAGSEDEAGCLEKYLLQCRTTRY